MEPRYTIVIPAHNAADTLELCLRSIAEMDYPRERYEVVVVDDGSTDETAAIAGRHGARVISRRCASIPEVRNLGARGARGEILAHLDSDMVVDPNWLNKADEYFDDGFDGVLHFAEGPPEDAGWVAHLWYGPYRENRSAVQERRFLASSNLLMRRATHEGCGGLNEELFAGKRGGSDREYTTRIRKQGKRLVFDPSLRMIHLGCERSLGEFLKKEWWRQGNTIWIARDMGWPLELLRTPLFSLAHLLGALLFVASLFVANPWISVAAFVVWAAPSAALIARRMLIGAHWKRLPAVWLLTFLRWNTAGLALIPQLARRRDRGSGKE